MTALDAKREEIAELVARELGFGDLAGVSPADRAAIDQQTAETIEGCGEDADEPADCTEANVRLRLLLTEYRQIARIRAGENDVRLAEEGEVFSREDDA